MCVNVSINIEAELSGIGGNMLSSVSTPVKSFRAWNALQAAVFVSHLDSISCMLYLIEVWLSMVLVVDIENQMDVRTAHGLVVDKAVLILDIERLQVLS